jgi:hypothetical protein
MNKTPILAGLLGALSIVLFVTPGFAQTKPFSEHTAEDLQNLRNIVARNGEPTFIPCSFSKVCTDGECKTVNSDAELMIGIKQKREADSLSPESSLLIWKSVPFGFRSMGQTVCGREHILAPVR